MSAGVWSSSGRWSTPSCRATTIRKPCRSCSARRWRSPLCSAPRSNSRASSSFRPRPTGRSTSWSPIIRCRAACAAMPASRPSKLAALPPDGRLLGDGHLAMTIDRGLDTERYQGVVPLEGDSLTEAADTYFRQSEQLPTFIRLAVARHYRPGASGEQAVDLARGRACSCRSSPARAAAARPGRLPSPRRTGRAPGPWPRRSRITSCSIPCCRPTGCSIGCSTRSRCAPFAPFRSKAIAAARAARVEELLKRFSAEDLADMVVDGEVWVTCEFCNSRYHFDPASFADA